MKLTEEQIKQALKCCADYNGANCSDCPCNSMSLNCEGVILAALDLINRIEAENINQQAEIERLDRENNILSKNADTAFQDGLNEAQDLYREQIKNEVRVEAIKEFAERLKVHTIEVDVYFGYGREHYIEAVTTIAIDNLVKEMAGEIRASDVTHNQSNG